MGLRDEFDRLPLDRYQVVVTKERNVAEGDRGKFHDLIEGSGRMAPEFDEAADL